MRRITIHVSDETAAALETDASRLQKTEMYLQGLHLQMKAQHPDDCTIPNCATKAAIDESARSIAIVGRVAMFQRDVLAAYRLHRLRWNDARSTLARLRRRLYPRVLRERLGSIDG